MGRCMSLAGDVQCVTKQRYRASCGSRRRWRRCVCQPIVRGLSSAAPAPARRRLGRLVGRWLRCPPLAGAVGGSRLSSQARGFPTAVSPELGEGGCSGATAVHARRAIARSPGVASLGLGGLSFGGLLTPGTPERSSSLWWISACACVVLSTYGQRRIEVVATKVTSFSGRSDRAEAARRMIQAVQGTERGASGSPDEARSTIFLRREVLYEAG